MTISIIIPIYNVECFIRRCLESVIEQEFNAYNIECILVDDCSTDRSVEIAQEIISSYHGSGISFILLQHRVNKGVSAARNTGVSAASGEFLFFIDSDDVVMENTLKYLFSYLVDHNHVDMVVGNSLWTEQLYLSNTPATSNKETTYLIDDKTIIWRLVLRRKIDRQVVNKLIRRSVIIDNNIIFDDNVKIYEDVLWTYKLYLNVSSLLIVPALTYLYEPNLSSLTHTTPERATQFFESLTIVSDFVFHHPLVVDGHIIHYNAHRLFASRWIMMAIDVKDKYSIDSDYNSVLASLKNTMLWDTIIHFQPFMTLFFLIMFAPMKYLLKYHWFRSNLYRIEKLVYKMS